jgi:hypothetical protein
MHTVNKKHNCSAMVSLEVNAEKTKYVFMSCEQNGGQHHNIHIGTFESVTKVQIFGNNSHLFIYLFIYSLIHSVVCLTTGIYS